MRVVTLVIILAIIAGGVYLVVFRGDLLEKGKQTLSGYTAAKTPQEAVERFHKAIKARNYKAAALYCTRNYADQLNKAADAAGGMGAAIDSVTAYATDKGLLTDKCATLLHYLDPFPPQFLLPRDAVPSHGDKIVTAYVPEVLTNIKDPSHLAPEMARLDPSMFTRVLLPPTIFKSVAVVAEGQGADKIYKLDIPLLPNQVQFIDNYINKHKAYLHALEKFRGEATNQRYGTKVEFEGQLTNILAESK